MIRYSPPKSNLWGHRTRRKKAADFRICVAEFMAEAVRKYTPSWCISVVPFPEPFSDADRAFANKLLAEVDSIEAQETYSQPIHEDEFDKCLDLLISHEDLFPRLAFVSLDCTYDILSWNFGEGSTMQPHSCELIATYGTDQMLGTMLAFASVDEYRWVKSNVKRIIGVELNDKHVRPRIAAR